MNNKNDSKIKYPMDNLKIITKFITKEEEKILIKEINKNNWNDDLSRLTQHYGYKYNYKNRNVKNSDYIGNLPVWFEQIINKIKNINNINDDPEQIIINRYLPGEGIGPHIDSQTAFKNKIYSISLGSGTTIKFKNKDITHNIYLPRRAFLLMENDARYKYTHEIEKKHTDKVKVNGIEKKRKRKTRYSITFRNVIKDNL
jgi:alkylated DNA repair dioxygenase AlkB